MTASFVFGYRLKQSAPFVIHFTETLNFFFQGNPMTNLKPSHDSLSFLARLLIVSYLPSVAIADETKPCQETVQYTFERGDTLSEILWSLDVSPLYGRKGAVATIISQNPDKFSTTPLGYVQAGTQLMLNLTDCPNPSIWFIENGILRKRPKVEPEPERTPSDTESTNLPSEIQEKSPTATTHTDPPQDVKPVPNTILEPVKEIVPPPLELEGELNDENLNKLLNL